MKKNLLKTKVEVFICNHKGAEGADCGSKGGKELTDELKKWAKENHGDHLKVYRSGCLGKCAEGIAAVCYPNREVWTELITGDVEKLKKDLEQILK